MMEVLLRHLPEGIGKIQIICVGAETRTQHLPNTSLKRYRYSSLLSWWIQTVSLDLASGLAMYKWLVSG
jgi:hypothetical protein